MPKLPRKFLIGTATAALQIEGGDKNNNWYRWSELGMVANGEHCITACDHWNRIDEDVQLMVDLGVDTYRLGLEWSRIQPEKDRFDEEAIAKYRYEIELLLSHDIKPLVTLWHFSHPLWFVNMGGWTNEAAIALYLNYTKYVLEHLGDLVSDWITFNEPNVFLTFGYFDGRWPPGEKGNVKLYLKAASHFIESHKKAYALIHDIRKKAGHKKTLVGAAHHLRIFDLYNHNPLSRFARNLMDRLFHRIFLEGMTLGKSIFPVKSISRNLKEPCSDFLGINYYTRDFIKGNFKPSTLFGDVLLNEDCEVNDLNWEIYPEGIKRICKKMHGKYKLPIFITENGTCDAKDAFRQEYIKTHLEKTLEAVKEGVDVQRFYYWTLMDNFEWTEGYEPRFGLYEVDFKTQERTLRKSGKYFKKVCETRKV